MAGGIDDWRTPADIQQEIMRAILEVKETVVKEAFPELETMSGDDLPAWLAKNKNRAYWVEFPCLPKDVAFEQFFRIDDVDRYRVYMKLEPNAVRYTVEVDKIKTVL